MNSSRSVAHAPGLRAAILAAALLASRVEAATAITEYPVPTQPAGALSIVSGPDGALWFTERYAGRIGRITTAGTVTEFPVPTQNSSPWGITAGPDGNLWFTEQDGGRVGRITPSGVVTEFAPPAPGYLGGIACGPDGNLWFAESSRGQIGRITPEGVVTEFPTWENCYPRFITSGPDGNLWFTSDWEIGRITTGGAVTAFPIPSGLAFPMGIASGPDDALWFTETYTGKIGRITTAGVITEFTTWPNSSPHQIVSGPDGDLWFTDYLSIGRITPAGVVTEIAIPTPSGLPFGITSGPDGSLWFAEEIGSRIGRLSNPLSFYTLPPCRILDTREAPGPLGGPALGAGAVRNFPFANTCGIPSGAVSVSGNITAVLPATDGYLRAFRADQPIPNTITVAFRAGRTRANSAVVGLSLDGARAIAIQNPGSAAVHVVLDVNGYFR